ncbi:MAG TPA: adenylate/guanylate cyclase domain-containing protein [Burkholderiales bacterium]|nr:adenylate/guanylate cyclase domain-containing protein [Burkholderiales bacterium]
MIRASAAVFILLLAAALHYGEWLHQFDMKLLDAQFKVLRSHALRPAPNPVVIVGFDDDTSRVLREPFTLWHAHFGKFLQAMAAGGAAIVGLDVVLPDRSYEFLAPGYDRQLLTSLLITRRTTPIVLALTVDKASVTRPIYPAFVAAAGDGATGYAILPLDRDGVVRRFDEQIGENDTIVPTLVGQMARKLGKEVAYGLIDFAAGEPFDLVRLQTVLAWQESGNAAALQRAFEGKAVLLGSILKYEDRIVPPVNLAAWDAQAMNVPGIVMHAQALRNLLNDGLVQPVARWLPLVLALAAALLWLWAPAPAAALAALLCVWIAGLALSTYALSKGVHMPIANIMCVTLIALGGRQTLEAALNLRERARLRRVFGGYVSPSIMREILAGNLHPTLGGVKQFACVLFSDIRGYTTRSERMTPEQTIAFLNGYFDRVVPIIHAHGGTVICFMGDGIMAVFGAPQPLANPCHAAFETTRAMLENLRELNADLAAKGEVPLEIGVGLHAGEGIAGHIGASVRHEYSVIGDVTNVASRLEGVTKDVGYRLVCSRAVADLVGAGSGLVPLGPRNIKGHSALEVFGYDKIDEDAKAA